MAEIIAYPIGQPDRQSQLIGTQVGVLQPNGQEVNLTRNFTVDSILGLLDNQFIISEFELTTNQLINLGVSQLTLVAGQANKYVDVNSVFFKIVGQTPANNLDFTGDIVIETTKPPGPWNYTIPQATLNSLTDPIGYKPLLTPGQVIVSEGIGINCSGVVNSVGVPTTTAKVYITYRFLS